jgi:hypothetical protein
MSLKPRLTAARSSFLLMHVYHEKLKSGMFVLPADICR